mmetsp:Transcript_20310/g.68960  ORF Transcript_20310/g.68960 Transcript_20310/m.68960 type:complete len:278 (+) Transcript_20310:99-932(+)
MVSSRSRLKAGVAARKAYLLALSSRSRSHSCLYMGQMVWRSGSVVLITLRPWSRRAWTMSGVGLCTALVRLACSWCAMNSRLRGARALRSLRPATAVKMDRRSKMENLPEKGLTKFSWRPMRKLMSSDGPGSVTTKCGHACGKEMVSPGPLMAYVSSILDRSSSQMVPPRPTPPTVVHATAFLACSTDMKSHSLCPKSCSAVDCSAALECHSAVMAGSRKDERKESDRNFCLIMSSKKVYVRFSERPVPCMLPVDLSVSRRMSLRRKLRPSYASGSW